MKEPTEGSLTLPRHDAGTPPEDRGFRGDIQGLRALAVGLVVLYHLGGHPLLAPGGFIGVDVFFVISGYVITGLLERERTGSPRDLLPGFYARRARRIIPAVTVLIVVTVLASYHWLGTLRGNEVAGDGRWSSVFLANWYFIAQGTNYFKALVPPSPLLHLWSLAVEEQFYLVFPLLFLLLARLGGRQRWRQSVLGGVLALSAISLLLDLFETASSPTAAYFSPLTRAWELGLGAALALSAPTLRRLRPGIAGSATWGGLLLIMGAALGFSASSTYPGWRALVPVVGAALVIGGGLASPRWGAKILLGTTIGLLGGEISYALYLWHYPIFTIAAQTSGGALRASSRMLLLLASIAIAAGSTYLLENPIRRSKRLLASSRRSITMGLSLVAASLLLCSIALWIHPAGTEVRLPGPAHASLPRLEREVERATRAETLPTPMAPPLLDAPATPLHPPSVPDHCIASSEVIGWVTPCQLGDPHGTQTLVLLGDSQADAWSGAVQQVALERGLRLYVLAMDGCQPWLVAPDQTAGQQSCQRFREKSHRFILSVKPAFLLIAGHATPGVGVGTQATGYARLLESLRPSGATTALLGHPPWFQGSYRGLPPAECASRFSTQVTRCSLPRTILAKSFGAFDAAMSAAGRRHDVPTISTLQLFCTSTSCPVAIAHRFGYQDRVHITWQLSNYVGRALSTVLDPFFAGRDLKTG